MHECADAWFSVIKKINWKSDNISDVQTCRLSGTKVGKESSSEHVLKHARLTPGDSLSSGRFWSRSRRSGILRRGFQTGRRRYLQTRNRGWINTERCAPDEVIPHVSMQNDVKGGQAAGCRRGPLYSRLSFTKQKAPLRAPPPPQWTDGGSAASQMEPTHPHTSVNGTISSGLSEESKNILMQGSDTCTEIR